MSSTLQMIQSSIVAKLATVEGLASAKAIPRSVVETEYGRGYTVIGEPPDSYPGATVCLNDDEIDKAEWTPGHSSGARVRVAFAVPVYVAVYAQREADDITPTGPQERAWELMDLVIRALGAFQPDVPAGVTRWPLEPNGFEGVVVDPNTHGVLMRWIAKFGLAI